MRIVCPRRGLKLCRLWKLNLPLLPFPHPTLRPRPEVCGPPLLHRLVHHSLLPHRLQRLSQLQLHDRPLHHRSPWRLRCNRRPLVQDYGRQRSWTIRLDTIYFRFWIKRFEAVRSAARFVAFVSRLYLVWADSPHGMLYGRSSRSRRRQAG